MLACALVLKTPSFHFCKQPQTRYFGTANTLQGSRVLVHSRRRTDIVQLSAFPGALFCGPRFSRGQKQFSLSKISCHSDFLSMLPRSAIHCISPSIQLLSPGSALCLFHPKVLCSNRLLKTDCRFASLIPNYCCASVAWRETDGPTS